jgi:hypothetical protein
MRPEMSEPVIKKRRVQSTTQVSITDDGLWKREPRNEDDIASAVSVSTSTTVCDLSSVPAKHRTFVFLMFDERDETRKTTSIEMSHNPPEAVSEFNSGERTHRKNGKNNVRVWKLAQWIGPFRHRRDARNFLARWHRSLCNLEERERRGLELAFEDNLNLFTYEKRRLIDMAKASTPAATPAENTTK